MTTEKQKIKIYTYYQNIINFKDQDKMIEFWKKSWADNGFEPIVLSLKDAQKSFFYEEFLERIEDLVFKITGKRMDEYNLSCFLRWLAYSTQPETGSFLVSDYDVINNEFQPMELNDLKDKLCFLDGYCPCLAYGNKDHFLNFCKDVVNITTNNLELNKIEFFQNNLRCFHDQTFLCINKPPYFYSKPISYVIEYHNFNSSERNGKAIHFSHHAVHEWKKNFATLTEINDNVLRSNLIKAYLDTKK